MTDPNTHAETLFERVAHHARTQPDAAAIVAGGDTVSYSRLLADATSLAAGLEALGIGEGDVVAVQLPNRPEFLTTLLATTARGAILQTLHMPYAHTELTNLLAHSGAKAVVVLASAKDRSPAAEVLALGDSLPELDHVIAVGGDVDGAVSFATVAATPSSDTAVLAPDLDRDYLLLYTSGTTSSPKGVAHDARRFVPNAALASRDLAIGPADRVLSLAPYSHLYGLFTLQISLIGGAGIAMVGAFDPATLLDDLAELQPTMLFTAPAHLAPFVAADRLGSELLAPTRVVCMSGAAVPSTLARRVDDLLGPTGAVIGLWGMTELQVGTYGRPDDPLDTRLDSVGRASPTVELRVVDADDQPVPAGEEGELQARGGAVFSAYLNAAEQTAAAFTADGWFRTGDLARIDTGGFVRLTGRSKEIINRGGIKYNPVEVETILADHPAITACAVIPMPDPVLGERACLCVEVANGASVTLDEIREQLAGLAKYKWPERIEVFDSLPVTPTRKIRRGVLADLVTERQP